MSLDTSNFGTFFSLFSILYIFGIVGIIIKSGSVADRLNNPKSTFRTLKLNLTTLAAPGVKEHTLYDLADIDEVYSVEPDGSFQYTSGKYLNTYELKKNAKETEVKTAHSVAIDYGSDRIVIIDKRLTEQQARAMRDLISEWKSDPSGFLEARKVA